MDTEGGSILVRGWQEKLRLRPEEVFPELAATLRSFSAPTWTPKAPCAARILRGFARCAARRSLPITAAGGIRSQREVRALERLGMNAAVGMALYLDRLR